jgi:ATP-binding cassette subfamily C protein/ATP-binding cassette subfamily C protein EexD
MSAEANPLVRAVRSSYPALFAVFVLSMFINLCMLVSPLYSMQVYDRVMSSRSITTLIMLTVIVVTFLGLYGVLEYARSGVLSRASLAFEGILRRPLFEAMMRAELTPQHRLGIQAIRDAELLRETVSSGLASTVCDLPWTPIFIALCFGLHPILGFVSLGGAVVLFLLALVTERLTKSRLDEASRQSREANTIATSALRNGDVVRGNGMSDIVLNRWAGAQSVVVSSQAAASESSSVIVAITKFTRMAVQTALLCAGAWLAIQQEISSGSIMASSIVMGRALAPIEQTVAQWKRVVACRAAYRRLMALFETTPALKAGFELPRPAGGLDVEDVVVWPLGSNRPSVKKVSLDLEPGESLAVVGASGAGKSSLIKAIAGVWPIREGNIRIDGGDYANWDGNRLGKYIGYLPQEVDLFPGTVAENIARLNEVDDEAVFAAARAAGAHEAILRLPNGYDTVIGEGGIALSGGMRQRVGLARAMYGSPSLVILDEPNSNLDEEGERALSFALANLKKDGRTVIIVTHRPGILSAVDKMLVMSFGQALAFGEREDVVSRMRGNRVAVVHDATAEKRAVAGPAANTPMLDGPVINGQLAAAPQVRTISAPQQPAPAQIAAAPQVRAISTPPAAPIAQPSPSRPAQAAPVSAPANPAAQSAARAAAPAQAQAPVRSAAAQPQQAQSRQAQVAEALQRLTPEQSAELVRRLKVVQTLQQARAIRAAQTARAAAAQRTA